MRKFNTDYVYVFTKKKYLKNKDILKNYDLNPNKLNGREVEICNNYIGMVDLTMFPTHCCKAIRRVE